MILQARQVLVPGVLPQCQVQGAGAADGEVRHPRGAEEQLLLRRGLWKGGNGERVECNYNYLPPSGSVLSVLVTPGQ